MEELANEGLMLVTIKAIMERLTECGPGSDGRCIIDGLIPASSIALQIHGSNTNPERWINDVHMEIFLTIGTPETRIVTVEFVEGEFGKTTGMMMRKIVWGWSLEQWGWKRQTRWNCEQRGER